jgi:hypothetical protein
MIRIQLDLPDDQVRELDQLMTEANIATRKDLFNNALTLFQWAAKAKRAGRIVASVDEQNGTAKELVMPALENISAGRPALKRDEPVPARQVQRGGETIGKGEELENLSAGKRALSTAGKHH